MNGSFKNYFEKKWGPQISEVGGHSNHSRWHQNVIVCSTKFGFSKEKIPFVWCKE